MSHISTAEIEELKLIMEDGFTDLIDAFVTDSENKLEQLQAALQANNPSAVRELAHSLKGASGNISAQPLADIYRQIEKIGKEGSTDGVAQLLDQAHNEFSAVKNALENL